MSASPDLPFVAAPPGALDTVTAAAEGAATHWGFEEPHLIRMGMNGIFAAGDNVLLRVGRPTAPPHLAIRLAEVLTHAGLLVPTYVREDPYVSHHHAVFAVRAVNESGPIDWVAVGEMISVLHRIDPHEFMFGYPVPFCGDFPWWNFQSLMDDVGADLDPPARTAIADAIGRCMPLLDRERGSTSVICHGDVHPGNVMQSVDGPVLLDWDLLCHGPAAWDHAPLLTWSQRWGGEPGIYESFAEGCGMSMRDDPLAEALAELRLVAATLMRVRATRENPAAAEEAELRLRYWRGDSDAPQWHPQ
ncbi:MAG: aminoglycoside phosphotransferase family protein [Ilumatobacteraceae bacterium]